MSMLLSGAVNYAGVAVLCSHDVLPWKAVIPLYQSQIEFNYLEEDLLRTACRVDNGVLRIADQTYRVLVVDPTIHADPNSSDIIAEFVRTGGCVMYATEARDLDALRVRRVLTDAGLRLLSIQPSNPGIRVSHFTWNDRPFLLVCNEGSHTFDGRLHVPWSGPTEHWDAWNATFCSSGHSPAGDERVQVLLHPRDSLLFTPGQLNETHVQQRTVDLSRLRTLREIELPPAVVEGVHSWYSCDVERSSLADQVDLETVRLYVGAHEVHELAEVSINGYSLGFRMWSPYVWDVTSYVNAGTNRLTVHVIHNRANELDGTHHPTGLHGGLSIFYEPIVSEDSLHAV